MAADDYPQTGLRERLDFLEGEYRRNLLAMDMAVSMVHLHGRTSFTRNPAAILEEAEKYVRQLPVTFSLITFLTIDQDALFTPARCYPAGCEAKAEGIVDHLVAKGDFAWALNQNRPLLVKDAGDGPVILHVLTTLSRVRGMLLAVIDPFSSLLSSDELDNLCFPGVFSGLLSIICHNTAYALESAELYGMLDDLNNRLQHQVVDGLLCIQAQNVQLRQEISDREDALRKYADLVHALGEITYEHLVLEGRIEWSQAVKTMLGYSPEEMGSDDASWTSRIHPDDLTSIGVAFEVARASEEGLFDLEYRFRHADGHYLWFHDRGCMQRSEDGRLVRVVGVMKNVHVRRSSEERLHRTLAELQRSNQELEQFAFSASHDLREPLRKIVTFGDLLMEEYGHSLQGEAGFYLERMQQSALRMQDLIADLLDYSRVTTRPGDIRRMSLHEAAEAAVSQLSEPLAASGGQIRLSGLPTVWADFGQMVRLFYNMLDNALTFRQPDLAPEVSVSGETLHAGWLRITVQDNGIGFEEKYAARIFKPFQRLHGKEKNDGTGMGLAICQRIVSRHQGLISAQSAPGRGACFIVDLPVDANGRPDKEPS